ncbi:MAG: hypothetical protein JKY86_15465 [Gammaproteobacteria bacterium]|nr:hypothetical protein [Gammaproteobacteria bacterium]
MTESDWEYTDEDGVKCGIELFPNESDCYWQVGEITHDQVSGKAYQIAYDLLRELHAQKSVIDDQAEQNLRLSLQSSSIADKYSELSDKFVGKLGEIERYRSALQEISDHCQETHGDVRIISDIATKALEDKQQ